MADKCIKNYKIGGGTYAASDVIAFLKNVKNFDNEQDGIETTYGKYFDADVTSVQDINKFLDSLYEDSAVDVKYKPEDITSGLVTEDVKKILGFLNRKSTNLSDKASNLRQTLIDKIENESGLNESDIAHALNLFESEANEKALIKKYNTKKRNKISAKADKNTAANPVVNDILITVFGVPSDKLAAAGLLQRALPLYEKFDVKDSIVDAADFADLAEEGALLMQEYRAWEDTQADAVVQNIVKQNTSDELIDAAFASTKVLVYDLPISELKKKYYLDIFKGLSRQDLAKMSKSQLANIIKGIQSLKHNYEPTAFKHAISELKKKKNGRIGIDKLNTSTGYQNTLGAAMAGIRGITEQVFGLEESNPLEKKLAASVKLYLDTEMGIEGDWLTTNLILAMAVPSQQAHYEYTQFHNEIAEINRAFHKKYTDNEEYLTAEAELHLFLYEREYQLNPGVRGVYSAQQVRDNIFDNMHETNDYNTHTVRIMDEINKKHTTDGKWDIDKAYDSLSEEQKAFVTAIDNDAKNNTHMIAELSAREGKTPRKYKGYFAHKMIDPNNNADMELDKQWKDAIQDGNVPTASSFFERKKVGRSMFKINNMAAALVSNKKKLGLSYHLGTVYREVIGTVEEIVDNAKSQGDEKVLTMAKGLRDEIKATIRLNLDRQTEQADITTKIISGFIKNSYAAQLVSVPRMIAEAISNLTYAIVREPDAFMEGMQDDLMWDSEGFAELLYALESTQISRLSGEGEFADPHREATDLKSVQFTDVRYASLEQKALANMTRMIRDGLVKRGQAGVDWLSDKMLTSPDRIFAKMLFLGSLKKTFRAMNDGQELDIDLLKAKTKEGEAYRLKHKTQLEEARKKADMIVVQAGSANEVHIGIRNIQRDPNAPPAKEIIRLLGNHMLRFTKYEFNSAVNAIRAIQGKGVMTEEDGYRLLTANILRQSLYMPLYSQLVAWLHQALGIEDEDDDDDIWTNIHLDFLGTLLNLGILRNHSLFGREALASVIEYVNMEYLSGLRRGDDYDPYKHGLVFSVFGQERTRGFTSPWGSAKKITGPFRPLIDAFETSARSGDPWDIAMYIATFGGILPVPKDFIRAKKASAWNKKKGGNALKNMQNYGKNQYFNK